MTDNDSNVRIVCDTQAYLFYLLGCTHFGDKSGTRVNIDLLMLLEDIHVVRMYAGGLTFLYWQLGLASRTHVGKSLVSDAVAGLDIWSFSYTDVGIKQIIQIG